MTFEANGQVWVADEEGREGHQVGEAAAAIVRSEQRLLLSLHQDRHSDLLIVTCATLTS
jgi:hypothetical protein